MRIIKKGTKTLPEEIIYVTKCRTCGCEFTYTNRNFHYVGECSVRLVCPQCKYYVSMPWIRKKYKGSDNK